MFIYIFEDGEAKYANTFTEDDAISCDDGIFDVIDVDSDPPKSYYGGEWHELECAD